MLWRSVSDNHLRHLWYTRDGDWGWETDLTATHGYGPVTRNPAVCSWDVERLDVIWRGPNEHLYHTWFDGEWGWTTDLSNKFASCTESSPAICSWEPGRLDLFWVDEDRRIQHAAYGRWQ